MESPLDVLMFQPFAISFYIVSALIVPSGRL